jgi:hypothetical protein
VVAAQDVDKKVAHPAVDPQRAEGVPVYAVSAAAACMMRPTTAPSLHSS